MQAHDGLSGPIESAGFRALILRLVDLMLMIPRRHPARRLSMPLVGVLKGRGFPKMKWVAVTNNLSPTQTSFEAAGKDTTGAELI